MKPELPNLEAMAAHMRNMARQLEQFATQAAQAEEKLLSRFNPRKFSQALYEAGEPVGSIHQMLTKRGVEVSRRTVERWVKPLRKQP